MEIPKNNIWNKNHCIVILIQSNDYRTRQFFSVVFNNFWSKHHVGSFRFIYFCEPVYLFPIELGYSVVVRCAGHILETDSDSEICTCTDMSTKMCWIMYFYCGIVCKQHVSYNSFSIFYNFACVFAFRRDGLNSFQSVRVCS